MRNKKEIKPNYMLNELNNDFQCKIPFIPDNVYDTALYDFSIEDKKYKNMWIDSGYNGYKDLVFYGKSPAGSDLYWEGKKLGNIIFPNFKTAYEFILNNKLPNYNLRCGCYKKEIEEYCKQERINKCLKH